MDTAREAGIPGLRLLVSDIGWDGRSFRDLEGREIRTLYKLYPWEWLVAEPFGRHVAEAAARTTWIEPIWKMIWSSKAILPILWDLFPRQPNLLWASATGPAGDSFVSKPLLGREGGNVSVVRDGQTLAAKDGPYGGGAMIWQGLFDLPDFGGARPVLGSWVVDGEPAGVGIREDGLITSNLSRFTPHILAD
jgi:glutathionylspermidine synthase